MRRCTFVFLSSRVLIILILSDVICKSCLFSSFWILFISFDVCKCLFATVASLGSCLCLSSVEPHTLHSLMWLSSKFLGCLWLLKQFIHTVYHWPVFVQSSLKPQCVQMTDIAFFLGKSCSGWKLFVSHSHPWECQSRPCQFPFEQKQYRVEVRDWPQNIT